MKIDIITLFPEMFTALNVGISGRAQQRQLLQLQYWNPRDYTKNKQKRVDDAPYGGGPGMVMQVQPLRDTLRAIQSHYSHKPHVIYLSPQGKRLTQQRVSELAAYSNLILLCGRYEGIDQRLLEKDIDEECSIGDYILTGGELATMVMIDAITRLLPDALGDPSSAGQDSFSHGLLDYPHYTRPALIDGQAVPEVLLHGDHHAIQRWRQQQALGQTWRKRPELLENHPLNAEEQQLLAEFIKSHQNNLS